MKAADVKLSSLKSYTECSEAVDAIESYPYNYEGGLVRWRTGKETVLLASAKKKIAAIWAKADKFEIVE